MTQNIKAMFPTYVYHRNVTEDYDREAVYSRVQHYLNEYPDYVGGNLEGGAKGFHDSFGSMHKDPVFGKLLAIIQTAIDEYWASLNYSDDYKPVIHQFWANQYPAGGWASMHHHSPVWLTGMFYLNCQPGKGNIYFKHPYQNFIDTQPIKDDARYEPHARYHEVELRTNDLVIFPGYIEHETVPYTGDDIRIVLPFEVTDRRYEAIQRLMKK